MEQSFFFWWSIISTIIALVLLAWDIWQLSAGKKEKEIHKSEVKLWLHRASGLLHGILSLVENKFSTVKDIQKALEVSKTNAYGLYSSLNEERLFTGQEIKERELKKEQEVKEFNKKQ